MGGREEREGGREQRVEGSPEGLSGEGQRAGGKTRKKKNQWCATFRSVRSSFARGGARRRPALGSTVALLSLCDACTHLAPPPSHARARKTDGAMAASSNFAAFFEVLGRDVRGAPPPRNDGDENRDPNLEVPSLSSLVQLTTALAKQVTALQKVQRVAPSRAAMCAQKTALLTKGRGDRMRVHTLGGVQDVSDVQKTIREVRGDLTEKKRDWSKNSTMVSYGPFKNHATGKCALTFFFRSGAGCACGNVCRSRRWTSLRAAWRSMD